MRSAIPEHPGPRHAIRRFHSKPARPLHIRAELLPGKTLHDAVQAILRENAVTSASMTLLGGGFSALTFTTGDRETRKDSPKQANFTFIREWRECDMISGAATAGLDVEGMPLLHCHAILATAAGEQLGGHLFPEKCVICKPVIAQITAHPGAVIQQFFDEETTHTIFNPVTLENAHVF